MKRRYWTALHWILIIGLLTQGIYGLCKVFFVIGGSRWPLFARAIETPVEVILRRRLCAIEAWAAIGGLAIYLALTAILPKRPVILQGEEEE